MGNRRTRRQVCPMPPGIDHHHNPGGMIWLANALCNLKGIVSSSPGLRAASYPGLAPVRFSTPTGLCPRSATRTQPRWGWPTPPAFPRVARGSQPWALGRNPFGIQRRYFRKALDPRQTFLDVDQVEVRILHSGTASFKTWSRIRCSAFSLTKSTLRPGRSSKSCQSATWSSRLRSGPILTKKSTSLSEQVKWHSDNPELAVPEKAP